MAWLDDFISNYMSGGGGGGYSPPPQQNGDNQGQGQGDNNNPSWDSLTPDSNSLYQWGGSYGGGGSNNNNQDAQRSTYPVQQDANPFLSNYGGFNYGSQDAGYGGGGGQQQNPYSLQENFNPQAGGLRDRYAQQQQQQYGGGGGSPLDMPGYVNKGSNDYGQQQATYGSSSPLDMPGYVNKGSNDYGQRQATAQYGGGQNPYGRVIDWRDFKSNLYGEANAQRQFKELEGVIDPNNAEGAAGRYGWNFVQDPRQGLTEANPQNYERVRGLAEQYAMRDPNTDFSVVNVGGRYNIATRPNTGKMGVAGQGYMKMPPPPPQVRPAGPPPPAGYGRSGGGGAPAPRYSSGSGGGGPAQQPQQKYSYVANQKTGETGWRDNSTGQVVSSYPAGTPSYYPGPYAPGVQPGPAAAQPGPWASGYMMPPAPPAPDYQDRYNRPAYEQERSPAPYYPGGGGQLRNKSE
jgi:hypothetical protein